jgi:hypothetical protein
VAAATIQQLAASWLSQEQIASRDWLPGTDSWKRPFSAAAGDGRFLSPHHETWNAKYQNTDKSTGSHYKH